MATQNTLDYGTAPTRLRKWRRHLFWLAILGVVIGVGLLTKPIAERWYTQWRYEREMARWYAEVANEVPPEHALRFAKRWQDLNSARLATSQMQVVGWVNDYPTDPSLKGLPYISGDRILYGRSSNGAVFSGELASPAGARAVFMIFPMTFPSHFVASGNPSVGTAFFAAPLPAPRSADHVFSFSIVCVAKSADGVWHTAVTNSASLLTANPGDVRMYAGTRDPRDPSKFKIPFDVGGATGWIDGALVPGPKNAKDSKDAVVESMLNSTINFVVRYSPAPSTTQAGFQ
jgi:hypothetical protein